MQGITTRYASYTPGAYDHRIAEIDDELDAARRRLATIDHELRTLRESETYPHTLANGEYQGTASTIAERVATERERFEWLQIPLESRDSPPLNDADMAAWLRILRGYEKDEIDESTLRVIGGDKVLDPAAFSIAISEEQAAKTAFNRLHKLQSHPAYAPLLSLGKERRAKLDEHLRLRERNRRRLDRFKSKWLNDALLAALDGRQAVWRALYERSNELIGDIDRLLDQMATASVSIKANKEAHTLLADITSVIEYFEAGGKWTTWGVFTPSVIKKQLYIRETITVDGSPATTLERLQAVRNFLYLSIAENSLDRAWVDYGGLPSGSEPRIRLVAIKEQVRILGEALQYAQDCSKLGNAMKSVAKPIPEPNWLDGQAREWSAIIDAAGIEETYRSVSGKVTTSLRELRSICVLNDAHPVVGRLVEAIEKRDVAAYSQAHTKILRIEQTRAGQQRRQIIETTLADAVPGLIYSVAATCECDSWDWRFKIWLKAWQWAIADNWLRKRVDAAYQHQLWQRRQDTDRAIGRLLADTAALRAWTHFFKRLSSKESAALKGWLEAVKAMGKGTGRSTKIDRLRREARAYMDQCRDAIPVWIMPRYLVAEMVDPAPGRYDLVIVDEASQLGIESLFLFYIAKKMVVVGDDQQISPYGVGIADDAIAGLQNHYLEGIPHHVALSAQSSLYANAKIRFGENIVLREHFRCVPEIIQFSNDLCYASNGTPLDPLRAYPANRLKPLVVRHVSDGYRTGSSQNALNEPEADALLAQIIACINDPRYDGRTMGVISLQGEAQAKLIENKLLEILEPEVIEERRIICGDAYAFQGDERHVIFLSMVAAPNERIGALTVESARQRFNVAASRAQDQAWLFHSATLDVLNPSCMRHRLLSYMLNPGRLNARESEHQFESQFERDVFTIIAARGFHVRTQVCVGDATNHRYRIDLVVEGMAGHLAVECDGDHWHGPERHEQDMARQRDLERSNWHFVRIRGGDFYRDRIKSMQPLWTELERRGIEPGGIDHAASEPPVPVDIQQLVQPHDEFISVEQMPLDDVENHDAINRVPNPNEPSPALYDEEATNRLPLAPNYANSLFAPYRPFSGSAGDDPRTVSVSAVAEGLCRIIETEGPVLAKRAYDIYLRGCGIKRLGHELRSTMNKALANAIRQDQIVPEDELGKGGLLLTIVRIKGTAPVNVRQRGPRRFEEIPPSELQLVARFLLERHDMNPGSDEHLRALLECFHLRRLTTQVGTELLEILDRKFSYVDDFVFHDKIGQGIT